VIRIEGLQQTDDVAAGAAHFILLSIFKNRLFFQFSIKIKMPACSADIISL
jgi:hypothetical protein